ncbi:OLC1v1023880C1 [Oldenlandia corymbosa var. corymbosa]|uniref:OLC1v1023880C1 n=1 Tax=Oldenlandia corymbosa var. corymbosa TaxID=529605 RepID=A0AAV1C3G7_OLDCO|nr:OLC1v1023880C1 [Oldenlandia corymbosa var. corymbosa]
MKTVTGKLVSTKPISLSNAAKYMSRFTSSENGASTAIAVYLHRTSEAFNGLVQFHKKLKGASHSSREEEEQVSQPLSVDAKIEQSAAVVGESQKRKKKKSGNKGENEESVGRGGDKVFGTIGEEIKQEPIEVEVDVKKEKKKKKRTKEVAEDIKVNDGETVDQSEHTGKKNGLQNGGGFDQIKTETFEDGSMNGAEGGGVGLQKRDKKKKKDRKEKEVEERFGNSMNKGNEADGDNISKQLKVEVKEEIDRVVEGSVELSDNKKKKKKKMKAEDEEVGRSFGGDEGKKRKSREVDGEETIDSAEQSGKKKKKKRRIE